MANNIQTFFPPLPYPATRRPWLPPPAQSFLSTERRCSRKIIASTAFSSFVFCLLLLLLFRFFIARRRSKEEEAVTPPSSKRYRLQQLWSARMSRSMFVSDDGLDAEHWREFNCKGCVHCNRGRYAAGDHVEDGEIEDGGAGDKVDWPVRTGRRDQEKPLFPAGLASSSSPSSKTQSLISPRQAEGNHQLPLPPNEPLPPQPDRMISAATVLLPRPSVEGNHQLPLPPNGPLSPQLISAATLLPSRPPAVSSPPQPKSKPNLEPPLAAPPPVTNSNAAAAPPPQPLFSPKPRAKPPPLASFRPNKPPARSALALPLPDRSGSGAPHALSPPATTPSVETPRRVKKLKPLHWDNVNDFNVENSMLWDRIKNGRVRVTEHSKEFLFSPVATSASANNSDKVSIATGAAPAQICLLDSCKSESIATALRSLAVSRKEIIHGLLEGHGLNTDILEQLSKIVLTKEEEELVRDYSGDPARLADAESFLFHIIRAVPAPFPRLNLLLLRANYGREAAHLKQSLRTMDEACKELKVPTHGLFLKLLETVLKACKRMNAGTERGNDQTPNLMALRELAGMKSADGSTMLLHFVVEEVVREEGKRLMVRRSQSLHRYDSRAPALERTTSRSAEWEEREWEYTLLGLPVVGGLSDEFVNVKKAAAIAYDALITACLALQARLADIKRLLEEGCVGGGFAREMRAFVDMAEEELKGFKAKQERVLEAVKKTTESYHPGASNVKDAQPLHLFMVVKDLLNMVDKACVDIARNLQKKKR